MENPSVFLYGPHEAKIEDRPVPTLNSTHDVIISIAYVGVCGSDVHFWDHGGGETPVSEPLVMGHEASGIVYAVGPHVTGLKPGDRVALEPGVPCRKCRECKMGSYNLCPRIAFAAAPPSKPGQPIPKDISYHGTLTKYYPTSADFCYQIPDTMSLQEAVLMEPLAVGVHAARLADIRSGHKVVVFGAGTVGLLCAAVAKAFGADVVVSVDILEKKLAFAKTYIGPDVGRTALVTSSQTPEQNARHLFAHHELEDGVDAVIDASGAEASVTTGVLILRRAGVYVQVGFGKRTIQFPIVDICEKEIVIKGSLRYGAGDFETAISLVRKGSVVLPPLISKEFPLEQATSAWDATARGDGIKNLIQVSAT
ncbi:GroES-like protein [Xylariaceae sp. FL1272]|nr:GroES-like protein [Xylariaceae sp. FL1272]